MTTRKATSSRTLFEAYQDTLKQRLHSSGAGPTSSTVDSNRRLTTPHRSAVTLVCEFLRMAWGQRTALVFAIATLTVATLLALIPPAATKGLVDYVLGNMPFPERWVESGLPTDRGWLLVWGLASVVAIQWFKALIHIWGRWYATRANRRIQISISKRLFEHTARLPLHRVYELKSGGVASILRQDATSVSDLVFAMLYNPWRAVVQLVGSLFVLGWVDWRLLMGALLTIPLIYFSHRAWIGRIRPQHRGVRAQRSKVDASVTEAFSGVRVVRGFSRERSEASRFIRGSNLMVRMQLKAWWYTRAVEVAWSLFIPAAAAALLLYGGRQVLRGTLTTGDLMMFLVYMLMLLDPVAVLSQSAATLQNGLSALDRILDLLEEPRETTTARARVVSKERTEGRITFARVSFHYPGTHELALHKVSLEVPPRTTYALVGSSGAGKTTLCNLVARFYDPTEGRILLDGVDLREYDVSSYRRLLGIVDQEVFLFDGTVAENIGYADRTADFDAIVSAAKSAYADDFIRELPSGYDTLIGERGVKLSGGQRQRLAIARALLADPRILILDEATSNLDTFSEQQIQLGLEALTANRTTFVIAHRLSTITHADAIVVMEQGSVLEVGNHRELISAGGKYSEMIQRQIDPHIDLADHASG